MKKMWYIHEMEHNGSLREKRKSCHIITWMNLKEITLSKISQSQKDSVKIPLI